MPQVQGLGETSLYVADLDSSARFYQEIFGFQEITRDDRLVALRVTAGQVLLLFRKHGTLAALATSGGVIPPHDGDGQLHLAFTIPPAEWDGWQDHLHRHQVTIESEVNWSPGVRSLYFRDPDRHLVELATPGIWKDEELSEHS